MNLLPLEEGQVVLVTGGSGFLGRAIVDKLLKKKLVVRILCRKDYPDLLEKGVKIFKGEISDFDIVSKAVEGAEVVFHTAAKAGIAEPYSEYERINVKGTENVVSACKKHAVKRLVYTSSPSVVFSHGDIKNADESLPYPDHHEAYYPKTKCMAEKFVLKNASESLATVSLRPHLIWGPGDNHLAPRLISKAKAGKLKFVGDGKNLVDSVFVENAADAHINAAERLYPSSPISGKPYFITNGEPMEISKLTNLIIGAAGISPVTATISPMLAWAIGFLCEIVFKTFRLSGEPPITRWVAGELSTAHYFCIDAAKKDLGYEPKVSIAQGIEKLRNYYQSNAE